MQLVLLAGGLGTRIRSVAGDLPKSLVPVAGRPFIDHQLELLARNGVGRVLLCVGYGADAIEAHLAQHRPAEMKITFSREDPEALLGTGGALVKALPLLEERFFTLYGDSYLPTDYRAVFDAFEVCGTQGMMCVFRNRGAWDKSNVRVEGGRVVFYSKEAREGEADFIDYGLTGLRRAVVEDYAEAEPPLDLARIQGELVARNELAAHEVKERFYEIGKPEGLRELDELLASGEEGNV